MRNSNKRRISLKTILIYCEGYCEYALCLYLKDLFHKRGGGFTVTIINGYGGSPVKTVERAMKDDGFNEKYVWIDTDRPEIEEARILAVRSGIILFENTPCFEKEILKMLGRTKSVKDYKKEFKKCFPEEDLCDERTYEKLFPKEKIDELIEIDSFIFENIVRLLKTGNI